VGRARASLHICSSPASTIALNKFAIKGTLEPRKTNNPGNVPPAGVTYQTHLIKNKIKIMTKSGQKAGLFVCLFVSYEYGVCLHCASGSNVRPLAVVPFGVWILVGNH
jgi:hypothetical protein